jgi:2-polyprenyl-3-methyl-5-hydroxy-6-metoxy-1,4-benzoquinol methylase
MSTLSPQDVRYGERGPCPVCRGDRTVTYIPFSDIPVMQCCGCGFMFSAKLMTESALESYYRDGFGSERHRQGQFVNARNNAWAVARLLATHPFRSILDVGTGYGFLLKELQDRMSVTAVGVELSEQEARYGTETLRVNIVNRSLSKAGLQPASFDVVSCFEVIEHIADPLRFVSELLEYMSPTGRLIAMTDNFESRVVQKLGPAFPKWIPHAHVSHFSPKTLKKVLSLSGLEIETVLSYTGRIFTFDN